MVFIKNNKLAYKHGLSKTRDYEHFNNHKFSARRRGINFQFTLGEWLKWWEDNLGPNWRSLRGTKGNQFCMSRLGDRGSYHPNNVRCLSNLENLKQTTVNGTSNKGIKNGRTKLVEKDVLDIFTSKESTSFLSRKHKISRRVVDGIRNKTLWTHITNELVNNF